MESFGGAGFSPGGCIVRKKRSIVSHKPRLNPPIFSLSYNIPIGKGTIDGNQNNKKKIVHPDGLGSKNNPKKLKLKFGGVTRTLNSKYIADVGNGGGSSTAKSSSSLDAFTPQLNPLAQDDAGGGGVNEPVRKSKRAPKRSALDAGFNEDDDEDEEIRFLGRLSASKVARSERIQMDVRFHGDDSGGYKPARLGAASKNRSRSEKMHEDKDYLGEDDEEELTSNDEPEPNGKKLKTGSLSLLLEGRKESTLTTRNRAFQPGKDILPGSGKKDKMSEVERQLKKAEAAQRRKVKLENAAREAEAGAIRRILGQDSKKKKEEKLKQQRDELNKGRTGCPVTLAPNTVRWVVGPNGTTVTFSDDIGLPSIFSPVPCSYPPPREKCAGPNCTNAYKYRDSKSKLPLCSLQCYRAIHEKMQPLITC
ncbi:uncharacterized protein LOC103959312 isoform X2 [Pyrus x bretschneideri]|uniref:uncharacterized protein LOC103959312 isoform X2 n=1 Tax=Pyrus x bretschneideri TaxID=225117 RepID=UPI00202F5049|nr:uncharacterized protein LOC103959312 isoform X2 [Pyrus x bretschneideri]